MDSVEWIQAWFSQNDHRGVAQASPSSHQMIKYEQEIATQVQTVPFNYHPLREEPTLRLLSHRHRHPAGHKPAETCGTRQ